jgi:hypothetical protein
MLLRTVNTVATSIDAQVVALPTLSWASFPNAAQYEVFVIDAGTTELVQRELVADTHSVVTAPLQPGRTQWVVNALAADGGLLADVRVASSCSRKYPDHLTGIGTPPVTGEFLYETK